MDQEQLNWLTNLIWNIADDVLRDAFVRGKYCDVILPMTVLRRLDAVLESTKQAVLEMTSALDKGGHYRPGRLRSLSEWLLAQCAGVRDREESTPSEVQPTFSPELLNAFPLIRPARRRHAHRCADSIQLAPFSSVLQAASEGEFMYKPARPTT